MKSFLLPACALLFCAPALAQAPVTPSRTAPLGRSVGPAPRGTATPRASRSSPVYRVELVVFRATSAVGTPEDWAAEAGTAPVTSNDADPGAAEESAAPRDEPATGGATQGTQSSAAAASGALPSSVVRLLPASDFQLESVASRLRASGRYVPVAHIAWAQTASPWGKPVRVPIQAVGLDAQGLTGTVALERGQFLHLVLDLRFAMSDPPPGLDAQPGTVFVLDESHRVRLRERNYFDHPAFGVIALVTSDEPSASRGASATSRAGDHAVRR